MLTEFNWLRASRTGAELIATLQVLEAEPGLADAELPLAPPPSAIRHPCAHCGIFAPANKETEYCPLCGEVMARALALGNESRRSAVLWGRVNRIPPYIHKSIETLAEGIWGGYIHDAHRFLLVISKRTLPAWLKNLAIYHGDSLRGLLQLLPTTGHNGLTGMGDLLTRAVYNDSSYGMDRLRVRYYPKVYKVFRPANRKEERLFTSEIADFLSMLEMAAVFRVLLRPEEQKMLHELLTLSDASESSFYWGRFLGMLTPEAKDMLNAWRIRQWTPERVRFLYQLRDYVYVEFS